MDFLLDFIKDTFRGFIRAMSAYIFYKILFKHEKTTQRRQKQKGGFHKK